MQDPLRDQTRPAKKQRQHTKPAPRVPTEPSRRSVRNLGKERPDYKVTARALPLSFLFLPATRARRGARAAQEATVPLPGRVAASFSAPADVHDEEFKSADDFLGARCFGT